MQRALKAAAGPQVICMYINTKGLVLRETDYKESSKILTVLTADKGKLTVSARGIKRKNSKLASGLQLFAFSDITLLESHGMWTATEAQSIELFSGLRNDLELLSLASYFADVLETLSNEDIPDPELLSLGLNALYALSELRRPQQLVKAAFELRAACITGFAPDVFSCCVCSNEEVNEPRLLLEKGVVKCASCRAEYNGPVSVLCPGSLDAMRHVVAAAPGRVFSFKLGREAETRFCKACEGYLLCQLDTGFRTLRFYKDVVSAGKMG